MIEEIKSAFDAATKLWYATEPEQQPGCGPTGCPGISGPSSNDANWTMEQGMLDGAICALQDVRKRIFG